VAGSAPELWRISLEEGRFMAPLACRTSGVNACGGLGGNDDGGEGGRGLGAEAGPCLSPSFGARLWTQLGLAPNRHRRLASSSPGAFGPIAAADKSRQL
jgi:hypothetical protein